MRFIADLATELSSVKNRPSNHAEESGAPFRLDDSYQYLNIFYRNKQCLWPFCGGRFDELNQFLSHLKWTHGFELNSQSNINIQSFLVDVLEKLLKQEKEILVSMFSHLQPSIAMPQQINTANDSGLIANPVTDATINNATIQYTQINNSLQNEHERVERNPPTFQLPARPISPSG